MKNLVPLLVLFLAVSPHGFAVNPPAKTKTDEVRVNEALDKLQKFWDDAKTYQAKFTQTVNSKKLGTRDRAEGTLYVSKPGKLRWESKLDKSFQIMNGKKLMYVHTNRRGGTIVDMVSTSATVDAKVLSFLAGTGRFKEIYRAKIRAEKPKTIEISLIPKEGGAETYIAEVDKNSYGIQSLTTDTVDTRAKIEFSDIQTNIKLDDSLFIYEPKSTDIVHKEG